ncbi:TetR/AcrR family transcriptional regulator [Streptomyces sp. NPDC056663]|uniref:TetR/AcrR family transcriptional regulator n=1 Tax=Streptomyces sp. NPDC056663 TaxID=3345899 RepID=UPI0036B73148
MASPTTTTSESGPRRRDARRNREAFLASARKAFAEHGADASLERIARDAGLAIGTLYRHFPHRLDLLIAALEPQLNDFFERAEAATRHDPRRGFRTFLTDLCELQASDRGFSDFVCRRFPASPITEPIHDRICGLASIVLERAQDSGAVRSDVTNGDVMSLLWANSRIIEATDEAAPTAWRRHLRLLLDGFNAPATSDLVDPPLTEAQLYAAMARLSTIN